MFSSPRSFSINGTKDLEFFIRIVNSLFPFERSLQPFNIAKLINLAICGSVNRKTSSFFPTFLYPATFTIVIQVFVQFQDSLHKKKLLHNQFTLIKSMSSGAQ